jgi:hypothetical protein
MLHRAFSLAAILATLAAAAHAAERPRFAPGQGAPAAQFVHVRHCIRVRPGSAYAASVAAGGDVGSVYGSQDAMRQFPWASAGPTGLPPAPQSIEEWRQSP